MPREGLDGPERPPSMESSIPGDKADTGRWLSPPAAAGVAYRDRPAVANAVNE